MKRRTNSAVLFKPRGVQASAQGSIFDNPKVNLNPTEPSASLHFSADLRVPRLDSGPLGLCDFAVAAFGLPHTAG